MGNLAKPIAILAGGVLVLFMALSGLSGRDTEIEQLSAGRTVTVTCQNGKPRESDLQGMQDAVLADTFRKCEEERGSQRGSTRLLFIVGLGLVGWGAFALHKAR